MNRTSFIKAATAITGVFAIPFTLSAKYIAGWRADKGFKVDAGKDHFDKPLQPFAGDSFYCKVSGKDTDGDMYVFESTRMNEGGPPLHVHPEQDEWWYILEGEFLVKVGDTTYTAKAGDFVFGPRNVPHTFAKTGTGQARMIIGFQPAGKMEEFFQKIDSGAYKNATAEERSKLATEHGFTHVGPALTILKR